MHPIAFYTEAEERLGLGHLRRCLTLAHALQGCGLASAFLLADNSPGETLVAAEGFATHTLRRNACPAAQVDELAQRLGAPAVVVDTYAFTQADFGVLGRANRLLAAIDDLADRDLDVDLVINSGVRARFLPYPRARATRYLLGPEYALLRADFAAEPHRTIRARAKRALISVGGSDPHRLTERLAVWTLQTLGSVTVDVIVGPMAGTLSFEAPHGTLDRLMVHRNIRDMRTPMLSADLAITGGGQTTYELAATGTPAIAIRIADNQTGNLEGLSAAGTLVWAGDALDQDLDCRITDAIRRLETNPLERQHQSLAGRSIVDGRGAVRVAQTIADMLGGAPRNESRSYR